MTAHWYFESEPDVWVEITDRIGRVDWEVSERAEEGQADMSTLVIDDPDGDFDIRGRIYVYCEEDESEADDDRLYGGIVVDQEIGRGGGEWLNPLGRIWTISLVDMNTNWTRRVMVGADTNRPAETDVERVQWLMTTTETNWATDRVSWISTANPKAMDACKYLGRTVSEIMDDCAAPSETQGSKNWYTKLIRDGDGDPQIIVWYGKDSLEGVYDSPLSLSNDQADWDDDALADGSSLVWPISMDTRLRRDPTRVYSGVYLEYDGGAVYRMSQDTIDAFSPWDFVAPNSSVKSKAKAIARAEGHLAELNVQDLVIHTTVELPAAKATMLRAGMRVPVRATHLPGFNAAEFRWCRVLTCSVAPVAAGERYRLTLELVPVATSVAVATGSSMLRHATDNPNYDYKVNNWVVKWIANGDYEPSGWADWPNLSPVLEYIATGTPVEGPYTQFPPFDNMGVGFRCLGSGTVTITYAWGWGEPQDPGVTAEIRVNGTPVASQVSRGHEVIYDVGVLVAADVAVVTGDEITCYAHCSGGTFFPISAYVDGNYLLVEGDLTP